MAERNYNVDNLIQLQKEINKMNPVDLADKLEVLPEKSVAIWIKLLNKDLMADTFTELRPENKDRILRILSEENIKDLVKELDEDELVDTLQELPANMVKKLMTSHIDSDRREIINELLGYPEDSVGSIMTVNFLSVKSSETPAEAMKKVMESDLDAEKLEQIWVTDDSLILTGFVYIADLIRNKKSTIDSITEQIYGSKSN